MSRAGRFHAVSQLIATATALVLVLTACSSAGPTAPGDLAAEVSAIYALTPEEQESQLRTLSADVEEQMLALSGLQAELGGPEQAKAAYSAMTNALVTRTMQFREAPGDIGLARFGAASSDVGRLSTLVGAGSSPSLGGMIFGGWMIGTMAAEGIVTSTNDAKPGAKPERDVRTDGQGASSSIVREASLESTSIDMTVETTANGVTGTLRVTMTINPCPDPAGEFTAKASMTASATTGSARVGSNASFDIELTGLVDDDARLAGYDVTTTSEAAEFGSGNNVWAEVTDTTSFAGGKVTEASRTAGRSAGNVPEGFAAQWADLGRLTALMLVDKMLSAAQKGWESGRCVALEPTTDPSKRTGLAPGASVAILAAPRSKVDGMPTGGTVTATLAGETSVDPAGSKVAADARFAYRAPEEKEKSATVSLEARSRRGVARAEVVFDTRTSAYTASGTFGNITFSGTIPDLAQPFTIAGAGGANLIFSYVPSDSSGRSGTMTYTGSVGGFKLSGSGSYTITGDEGGVLVLAQSISVCNAGPLGCSGGDATITLTPAD